MVASINIVVLSCLHQAIRKEKKESAREAKLEREQQEVPVIESTEDLPHAGDKADIDM